MMTISARMRFRILARDGHACVYCGARPPDVRLVIDHVIPRALGGTDHPSNLAAACDLCNAGKSDFPADTPIGERTIPMIRRSSWSCNQPEGATPSPTTRVRGPRETHRIHISHFIGPLDEYGQRQIKMPCGSRICWEFNSLSWLSDDTEPTCGMCLLVPRELRNRPGIKP